MQAIDTWGIGALPQDGVWSSKTHVASFITLQEPRADVETGTEIAD